MAVAGATCLMAACASAADFGGLETAGGPQASLELRNMASWVLNARDHRGRPFAIVDKKNAQIRVFDGNGRLQGTSAVLLGQATGDHTAAGVGDRAQVGDIPMNERTTPAGRFDSRPGRNLRGEHVVWADYESAFAIHPVRAGPTRARRDAQLASPTAKDNRASLGCVVVPVNFYQRVVLPAFGSRRGVIYVLPETGEALDFFEAYQAHLQTGFVLQQLMA